MKTKRERSTETVASYDEAGTPPRDAETGEGYELASTVTLVVKLYDRGIHDWRATTKNYPEIVGTATTRDGALASLLFAVALKKGAQDASCSETQV